MNPQDESRSKTAHHQKTSIIAKDGFELIANLFEPISSDKKSMVALIGSATGIPQGYYFKYAAYLARNGITALTFDNRGIGASMNNQPLSKINATITDWATKDYSAVLDYLHDRYPSSSIVLVGHSVGGHVIGLIPNNHLITKAVTVSSQSAYWKLSKKTPMFYWFLWNTILPLVTRMYGYFPGKQLGLFGDLPKGVLMEWSNWCMQPDYMCHTPEVKRSYSEINFPILSFSFTDDQYASFGAVKEFHNFFKSVNVVHRHVDPQEIGVESVGHVGFFRKELQDSLWKESVDFLLGRDFTPKAKL